MEPNLNGRLRRSTDVEVWRVATDANLHVSRLDGAAEELGGYALGELNVHVHLLQCLVPLEHLLPCLWQGHGDQTLGQKGRGQPQRRQTVEGAMGGGSSKLCMKAWRFPGASFSDMAGAGVGAML